MCDSSNFLASKFVSVARIAVIRSSGQQNYMGEFSRLPIASSRLRPMETFLLILFSSLIGIGAPYSFLYYIFNIIISFPIIILQMTVIVLCGHWGNHMHEYSSIHLYDCWVIHCLNSVLFFFFQIEHKKLISCCHTSCPPVFQLYHICNWVSSLHNAYCAVLSSFTTYIIFVLSSSP